MVYHQLRQFSTDLNPVLARMEGQRSPRLITLDPNYATGYVGADGFLQKIFAPGYFAGSIPGSSKARILPRSKPTQPLAASGTSLYVLDAGIYIPTDVLAVLTPFGTITIGPSSGSTWAAADTATATVDGVSVTYTVQSADVAGTDAQTNQAISTGLLNLILADFRLANKVNGVAAGGIATLWSKDMLTRYSLAVSKSSTNGTITASGSAFAQPGAAIGTVTAIDTANDILTIGAGASTAVPVGVPVGVANSSPVGLGMIQPTQPIDLLRDPSGNYALFTSASVYGQRLPYWDGQLQALFPEITFASLVGGY